ncbi:MAG: esterase family protein [Bacteroides sp.]|nr:esterase family protein [Bacteroides sp.]
MKRKKMLMAVLFGMTAWMAQAARVDTVMVKSPSMDKEIKVVYVLPEKALQKQSCPVLYLLHGFGDNATGWIKKKPELKEIADAKGIIVVCPDGAQSWYWDSPKNPESRYETFVSTELVKYTDAHYPTVADRKGRAITGLSMGGHGALWLSFRHKDVFGAAGSMSGGVDIRPFPQNWNMQKQLGEFARNKAVWDAHTVTNQLDKIENGDLALIIDCGEDDFFYEVNKELHRRLAARGIAHDFIVRPGAHTWSYWINSLDFQLLFFEKFFNKQ